MVIRLRRRQLDARCEIAFTERADGDFAWAAAEIEQRRRQLMEGRWTWLRQVHGAEVVRVTADTDQAGVEADGAVTDQPGQVLSVLTADCAPVVLYGTAAVGIAHAGWRGLLAGIVERVAAEVEQLGGGPVRGILGPCIRPSGYEFGAEELAALADHFGQDVSSSTSWGAPALDVPAAVRLALARAGATLDLDLGRCTSDPALFSHRTRGDRGRQVAAVRIVAPDHVS